MTQQNNKLAIVGSKSSLKSMMESPDFKDSVKLVASKYMTTDKIMKAALLALSRQPKLLKCTKASFLQATIRGAESGLDFGGGSGQAYLVPYYNSKTKEFEAQFQPGYQGYIEVAYRGGKVSFIDVQLVYKHDQCEYELGANPFIKHKPLLMGDRGEIVFGYAIAYLAGSEFPKIEIMRNDELEGIKQRTKSKDRNGNIVGPWATDDSEMRRKTLIRRIYKYLPKTPEMMAVLETDQDEIEMFQPTEDLAPDKSNLGGEGLKKRIKKAKKVKSKDVLADDPDPETKAKVAEQKEKLQQAEKPKRYKCTASEDFCGIEIEESQLVMVDGRKACPECQNEVKEIE